MAFTATDDLLLQATVTGSWPRPRWYTQNMEGRALDTAMMDPWYREQFADAHAIVVSDQARAGLDIVTTGDYHLDSNSPCAAPNNPECGQIGVLGIGCGGTAVVPATWGRIKAMYLQ